MNTTTTMQRECT